MVALCTTAMVPAVSPLMAQDDPMHPPTKPQSNTKMTAQEKKNMQVAESFWREAVQGHHVEAIKKYVAPGFVEHNPNMTGDGMAALEAFVKSAPPVNPVPKVLDPDIVVKFAREDYVVFVYQHKEKDPADASKSYFWNSFDVVRFENGKIKEHWDDAYKNAPAK
jgi:predicted SnoaL-like aldol condensation-catalyzing enzyme